MPGRTGVRFEPFFHGERRWVIVTRSKSCWRSWSSRRGARDGLEDLAGGSGDLAALEPGVVVRADPGEVCDLFAAQAGDPASPAVEGHALPSGVSLARREVRKLLISDRESHVLLDCLWRQWVV
jgi:hypothetical protein